eukprot:gene13831-15251_t
MNEHSKGDCVEAVLAYSLFGDDKTRLQLGGILQQMIVEIYGELQRQLAPIVISLFTLTLVQPISYSDSSTSSNNPPKTIKIKIVPSLKAIDETDVVAIIPNSTVEKETENCNPKDFPLDKEVAKEKLIKICKSNQVDDVLMIQEILSQHPSLLHEGLNQENQSLLICASQGNKVELVKYLLELPGFDYVNRRQRTGDTARSACCRDREANQENKETILTLLKLQSEKSATNTPIISGYFIHFDENYGGWSTTKSLVDKIMAEKPGTKEYNQAFEEGVTFVYENPIFYSTVLTVKVTSDFVTLYNLALVMQAAMPAKIALDDRTYMFFFGFILSQCGVDATDSLALLKVGNCIGGVMQQLKREYVTYSIEILGVWRAMTETGEISVQYLQQLKQSWDAYFSSQSTAAMAATSPSYNVQVTVVPVTNIYDTAFMLSGVHSKLIG